MVSTESSWGEEESQTHAYVVYNYYNNNYIIYFTDVILHVYFTTGEQTTVAVDAANRWTGQSQYSI